MAQIYVRPTNGSDASGGTTYGSAKQTIAGACAIATGTDEIVLAGNEGSHTINSLITFNVNLTMYTYPGHTRANIVGSQHISGTIGTWNIRDITFNNGTTSGSTIQSTSLGHSILAINCDFGRPITQRASTASRFTFLKCKFLWAKNSSTRTNPIFTPASNGGSYIFDECDMSGPFASTSNDWASCSIICRNSKLYYGPSTGKIRITGVPTTFWFFDYNTIDDETSVINYSFSGPASTNAIAFFRNYINCSGQIIQNTSSGSLSMESVGASFYNILSTSTLTTGYSSISDTTTAAPQFYNASTNDYRIEIDSPLASYNGDIVGAMSPDFDSFWSSVPEAKVESGYAYRDRSRTNNKTGTLAAAGETDGNKVLNTSTIITGLYSPPANTDVKVGVNFGVADTGTYDGSDRHTDPGESNVRLGTAYKSNSATNNKTGTLDLPAQADVKSGITYDNVSKTGSYDPITGSWEAVAAADLRSGTTKKQNGSNVVGLLDLPSISNVKKDINYDNNTKTGTLESTDPGESNVKAGTNYKIESLNKTGNRTDASASNVLTGSGTYGANGTEITPSYSPDFPSANSVLTTDTTNGTQGTVTLPAESAVSSGTTYGANNSQTGTANLLDLNKFTDVPTNKVESGYDYKYNSLTNNRQGTLPIEQTSTDPGEWNVLKDVPYNIDGVNKLGKYQTGELQQTAGDNIRIQILKEIENTLYRVNPAVSAVYQNTIKTVSLESGLKQGVIQDDMPFVQVIADENSYDHKFVLSGNKPQVTMRVKFLIISPSNWNLIDNESLYEDIRQAFIRDNFTLNGLVLSVKVIGVKQINSDSDKADDNRRAEMSLEFIFIEQITNLN